MAAQEYELRNPTGKFSIKVKGAERRDVFVARGYTLVKRSSSAAPKRQESSAKPKE
jgi:hypothetical protein